MKIYRSRRGMFLGVCQGLADLVDIPVKYIRVLTVVAALFTLGGTVVVYLLAALLMPVKKPEGYEKEGFRENMEDLKDDAVHFVRREFDDLRRAGHSKKKDGETSGEGSL